MQLLKKLFQKIWLLLFIPLGFAALLGAGLKLLIANLAPQIAQEMCTRTFSIPRAQGELDVDSYTEQEKSEHLSTKATYQAEVVDMILLA